MFNIKKYLDKATRNVNSKELYIEGVSSVIERTIGIKIEKINVEIKNAVVCIKSSPAVKNKIFIHKKRILEDLAKEIPVKLTDIT